LKSIRQATQRQFVEPLQILVSRQPFPYWIMEGLPVVRQVGSGLFSGGIGVALHVELAIIFMYDSEAESLVEPASGIDSDNIQAHCKIELIGFANQSLHHLCADAPALKRAIHKHLCDKEPIILRDGLQPAYIRTVEGYHTDLRRVPLLPEAGFLSGSIQMQFFNDPSHFDEIETSAVLKVVVKSWTQFNRHRAILQH
jgi:hypothetical protein